MKQIESFTTCTLMRIW